jgi:hypothetical protein
MTFLSTRTRCNNNCNRYWVSLSSKSSASAAALAHYLRMVCNKLRNTWCRLLISCWLNVDRLCIVAYRWRWLRTARSTYFMVCRGEVVVLPGECFRQTLVSNIHWAWRSAVVCSMCRGVLYLNFRLIWPFHLMLTFEYTLFRSILF